MSKRLEQFIKENRSQLDSYEPADKVWQAIEKNLTGNGERFAAIKQMIWIKWVAVAAIFVLVASTIYFFLPPDPKNAITHEAVNTGLPPEYAEEVYHFTRLIEIKHKELQKIEKEHPTLYRQFAGDINKLDSNYQVLKKELPDNPNQEMLIQAMIGNLKWQIDLLNQQLTIIQKIKLSKKSANEKTYKST